MKSDPQMPSQPLDTSNFDSIQGGLSDRPARGQSLILPGAEPLAFSPGIG